MTARIDARAGEAPRAGGCWAGAWIGVPWGLVPTGHAGCKGRLHVRPLGSREQEDLPRLSSAWNGSFGA